MPRSLPTLAFRSAVIALLMCATVIASSPPQHARAGYIAIWTDKTQYHLGDPIQVCYSVPAAGPFSIVDYPSDGTTATIVSAYDDGTGGCFVATVTPPTGAECLSIVFGDILSQTCFTVFDGQASMPQGMAYAANEGQNGQTISLRPGDTLNITLSNTYWTLAESTNTSVLALTGQPSVTPAPVGSCLPGVGCGTASASYQALASGQAQISATRTSCGEALRCSPGQGAYVINVVVTQ